MPCTLSFIAIVHCVGARWMRARMAPSVYGHFRVTRHSGIAATRHHLRPLAQAAHQRNKQLNQPTNLAAQKTGRSQISCVVFVVCLTVSRFLCPFLGPRVPDRVFFGGNNCEAFTHFVSFVKKSMLRASDSSRGGPSLFSLSNASNLPASASPAARRSFKYCQKY